MRELKLYLRNGLTTAMAVVFFVNITLAHSVDFHLCQGELQSIAFFGQKATCSKMMEAQQQTPRSCCDQKMSLEGLHFKQKSCCDNLQVVQDNLFAKPAVDVDIATSTSWVLINNFPTISISLKQAEESARKVEIPPPPNIDYQHSQENLQVFVI